MISSLDYFPVWFVLIEKRLSRQGYTSVILFALLFYCQLKYAYISDVTLGGTEYTSNLYNRRWWLLTIKM